MECGVCVSSFIITVGGIFQNNIIYFTMSHEFGLFFHTLKVLVFPLIHVQMLYLVVLQFKIFLFLNYNRRNNNKKNFNFFHFL